jgi:hypothetical protein
MRKIFIGIIALASLSVFADSDVCSFKAKNGTYAVQFDYGLGEKGKDAQVTISLNNRVQISHLTKTSVDPNSFGDGWSMILKDRKLPQYVYDLYFEADDLRFMYLTMPGLKNFKVVSCRNLGH